MLEFFHDCFYAIGEAQTDALPCMGQVLFGAETIFICAKGVTTGCKAVALSVDRKYSIVVLFKSMNVLITNSVLFYSIPYPWKVFGAPQMISQQSLSILSCFQLP